MGAMIAKVSPDKLIKRNPLMAVNTLKTSNLLKAHLSMLIKTHLEAKIKKAS